MGASGRVSRCRFSWLMLAEGSRNFADQRSAIGNCAGLGRGYYHATSGMRNINLKDNIVFRVAVACFLECHSFW